MALSLTEQLQYTTIRIECMNDRGGTSTGTGYFFAFKVDPKTREHIPVVITNKHVIEGSIEGNFVFTLADQSNNPLDTQHYTVKVQNFESHWVKHPDPDVDLCAMPIAFIIREVEKEGKKVFYRNLDSSIIPTEDQLGTLAALEDIIMVGYPNGIWDHINNKPIFRKGVTATHPFLDYRGKKEFMIDAACFPGSSGSPIFLLNEGGYRDRDGNTILGETRLYLLGTLYAGPQHTATGEIRVVDIPTNQKPIAISTIPNNLGLIIKSSRIKELENLF